MSEQSSVSKEGYPVRVEVEYPKESSRLLALLGLPCMFGKMFLLIPHLIILYFLGILSMVIVFVGYGAVLFTGKYPKGLFDLVAGILCWQTRVSAWMYGLTDKYPPF